MIGINDSGETKVLYDEERKENEVLKGTNDSDANEMICDDVRKENEELRKNEETRDNEQLRENELRIGNENIREYELSTIKADFENQHKWRIQLRGMRKFI